MPTPSRREFAHHHHGRPCAVFTSLQAVVKDSTCVKSDCKCQCHASQPDEMDDGDRAAEATRLSQNSLFASL
eukprot:scaffold208235_cov19-Tisochrysis_lutea.AAC.1